jgi:3-oxoadipate enol-lactonase
VANLKIGDASLHYEAYGEGPAIVLMHGIGGNHASWFQQIPALAASYTVVAIDHRGFGLSTDPQSLGRGAFVGDLLAIVDHLQLERFALVGQSMGAGTCGVFAHAYPQRVAALVLSDSTHSFEETGELAAVLGAARAATDNLPQLERVLAAGFPADRPDLACLYKQISGFNAVGRKNLGGRLAPLVTPESLAAKGIPILLIVGQEDRLFPPRAIKILHERMPGSMYVEISGSGHSPYFERPAEFNDSVLTFLQAVRYRGRTKPAHSNAPGYRAMG